jgi:carbonic anhydrase/acetyltransferase-like protein (isoleucine patch superfamily)
LKYFKEELMKNIAEEIYKIKPNELGWRRWKNGEIKIGENVFIGAGAKVGKGATVGARAEVGEGARVGEGAEVGSILVVYGKYTANDFGNGFVRIGCQVHTPDKWREKIDVIVRQHNESLETKKWALHVVDLIEADQKFHQEESK